MSATKMHAIIASDTHTNKILCGQGLRSLVHENPSPVPLMCVLSEYVKLIHIDFNQCVGTVFQALDIRSIQDTTRNTPPQVDISTYNSIRKKTSIHVVEMWRCKAISFHTVSKCPGIFSLKKIFARFSPYYGLREIASLSGFFIELRRTMVIRASCPICINPQFFEHMSLQVHMLSVPVSPPSLRNYF
jgi:hypothetical protein